MPWVLDSWHASDRLFTASDRRRSSSVAYAHCDIPCGIYDPHTAQIAA